MLGRQKNVSRAMATQGAQTAVPLTENKTLNSHDPLEVRLQQMERTLVALRSEHIDEVRRRKALEDRVKMLEDQINNNSPSPASSRILSESNKRSSPSTTRNTKKENKTPTKTKGIIRQKSKTGISTRVRRGSNFITSGDNEGEASSAGTPKF